MINYKDQSGALTKDPIWGIGSWLLTSPVLVSEPPQCVSCFWSRRPLLGRCRCLAHLPFRPDPFNAGENKLSQSWPAEEGRGRETWVAQKCFLHCSDGHHTERGAEETLYLEEPAMLRQQPLLLQLQAWFEASVWLQYSSLMSCHMSAMLR